MARVLGAVFRLMPLLFGVGFIAPIITQLLTRTDWPVAQGPAPLAIGLAVGVLWGGYATLTGRWL